MLDQKSKIQTTRSQILKNDSIIRDLLMSVVTTKWYVYLCSHRFWCKIVELYKNNSEMIVLPWFVRFGLDCTIALTPIVYLHYHPTTFVLEYFQNRRRLVRRKCMPLNMQPLRKSRSTLTRVSTLKKPNRYSNSSALNTDTHISQSISSSGIKII